MVVLNKIYTRTGDKGRTALGSGKRVSKASLRVEAYGTVDETNATVGLARVNANGTLSGDLELALARIQNDLFDLGSDLCHPTPKKNSRPNYKHLRITEVQVKRLESEIDSINKYLMPLNSFVLPGGSVLAASLHLCRTVSRRAERRCITLNKYEHINSHALHYINRLSDWFFVASRVANNNGENDVLWQPGMNGESVSSSIKDTETPLRLVNGDNKLRA